MCGIELRFLRNVDATEAGCQPGGSHKVFVLPGHNLEQRRLTGTVGAQDPDLGSGIERQPDPFQDLFFVVKLPQILHREDVLFAHGRCLAPDLVMKSSRRTENFAWRYCRGLCRKLKEGPWVLTRTRIFGKTLTQFSNGMRNP